jgi:hypothetical protein
MTKCGFSGRLIRQLLIPGGQCRQQFQKFVLSGAPVHAPRKLNFIQCAECPAVITEPAQSDEQGIFGMANCILSIYGYRLASLWSGTSEHYTLGQGTSPVWLQSCVASLLESQLRPNCAYSMTRINKYLMI